MLHQEDGHNIQSQENKATATHSSYNKVCIAHTKRAHDANICIDIYTIHYYEWSK